MDNEFNGFNNESGGNIPETPITEEPINEEIPQRDYSAKSYNENVSDTENAYKQPEVAQPQPDYSRVRGTTYNPYTGAPVQNRRYECSYGGNSNGEPASSYSPPDNGQYGCPPGSPHSPKSKKKRRGCGLGTVIICSVVTMLLTLGICFGGYMYITENHVITSTGTEVMFESTSPVVESSDKSIPEVAASVADSVVEITTETKTTSSFFGQYVTTGAGSGVVVSADGYIVTNNHVIDGASSIKVKFSDKDDTYTATLIGTDEKTDIAVIKIEATGLTPAVFGDSSKKVVGESVVVVGNPLGSLGGSVTSGIISALDREITIENQTMTLMQIDAAVNPGNSGGGAFDMNGNLIGIVNAKSSGSDVDNIGFFIPVNTAREVITSLIENGYVTGRISTGFTPIDLTDSSQAMSYRVSRTGIYVYSVQDDNSQFRSGDLLVSMDGTVISSMADYNSVVDKHNIGDTISVIVIRDSQQLTLNLTFSEYVPSEDDDSQQQQQQQQQGNNGSSLFDLFNYFY